SRQNELAFHLSMSNLRSWDGSVAELLLFAFIHGRRPRFEWAAFKSQFVGVRSAADVCTVIKTTLGISEEVVIAIVLDETNTVLTHHETPLHRFMKECPSATLACARQGIVPIFMLAGTNQQELIDLSNVTGTDIFTISLPLLNTSNFIAITNNLLMKKNKSVVICEKMIQAFDLLTGQIRFFSHFLFQIGRQNDAFDIDVFAQRLSDVGNDDLLNQLMTNAYTASMSGFFEQLTEVYKNDDFMTSILPKLVAAQIRKAPALCQGEEFSGDFSINHLQNNGIIMAEYSSGGDITSIRIPFFLLKRYLEGESAVPSVSWLSSFAAFLSPNDNERHVIAVILLKLFFLKSFTSKTTFKISDVFPWVHDNGYRYYFPTSYRYMHLDKHFISCDEIRNLKSHFCAFINAANAPHAESYLQFRAFVEHQPSAIFTSVWCVQSQSSNAAKKLKFSQLVPVKSSVSTEKAKINPGPHDLYIYMTDVHSRFQDESEIATGFDIIVDSAKMKDVLDASSHKR
ncbi:hypothetical protein ROZALSC1DRAFT_31338, partial [Rozella allomycis CSF55]